MLIPSAPIPPDEIRGVVLGIKKPHNFARNCNGPGAVITSFFFFGSKIGHYTIPSHRGIATSAAPLLFFIFYNNYYFFVFAL